MKFNVALNVLKKYGPIYVTRHIWLQLGRKLAEDHEYTGIWLNYKRSNSTTKSLFNAPDIQVETTYDDCVECKLEAHGTKIQFTIIVYDGDMVDGYPTSKRCEFTFNLTDCPQEFDALIERQLEAAAKRILDKEDEELYRMRMAKAVTDLTAELNRGDCTL